MEEGLSAGCAGRTLYWEQIFLSVLLRNRAGKSFPLLARRVLVSFADKIHVWARVHKHGTSRRQCPWVIGCVYFLFFFVRLGLVFEEIIVEIIVKVIFEVF